MNVLYRMYMYGFDLLRLGKNEAMNSMPKEWDNLLTQYEGLRASQPYVTIS